MGYVALGADLGLPHPVLPPSHPPRLCGVSPSKACPLATTWGEGRPAGEAAGQGVMQLCFSLAVRDLGQSRNLSESGLSAVKEGCLLCLAQSGNSFPHLGCLVYILISGPNRGAWHVTGAQKTFVE